MAKASDFVGFDTSDLKQSITYTASDYTLTDSDDQSVVNCDTSSNAITITVPSGITAFNIKLFQGGLNPVKIVAGSGVTINASNGRTQTGSPWTTAWLFQKGTDNWILEVQDNEDFRSTDDLRQVTATRSSDFTLSLSDEYRILECASGSAFTITVPSDGNVSLPIGYKIKAVQGDSNAITFSPQSGVTINAANGRTSTNGQWSSAVIYKAATDTWNLEVQDNTSGGGGGSGLIDLPTSVIGQISNDISLDLSSNSVFELEPTADIKIGVSGLDANSTRHVAYLYLKNGGDFNLTFDSSIVWDGTVKPPFSNSNFSLNEVTNHDTYDYDGNSPTGADVRSMTFNANDTKMYLADLSNQKVHQYSLAENGTLNSVTHEKSLDVSGNVVQPRGVEIAGDGLKLFVADNDDNHVHQYGLSSTDDIGSVTYEKNFDPGSNVSDVTEILINPNGDKFFFADYNNSSGKIREFTLSTNNDIGSASFTDSSPSPNSHGSLFGLGASDDGKTFITMSGQTLYHHSLSTPWDLSSGSYNQSSFDTSSFTSDARTSKTNSSLTRIFLVDNNDTLLHELIPESFAVGEVDLIELNQYGADKVMAKKLGSFVPSN